MRSNGPLVAVSFLTRLPVGVQVDDERDIAPAVKWFPVVGLGIGLVAGGVHVLLSGPLAPIVAGTGAVAVAVGITGAFHEDGLADTFDGLGTLGPAERRLEVMGDPRLGTFGVSALVLVLVARVTLIAQLDDALSTVAGIAWAHGLSRAAAVGVMVLSSPASPSGLGAAYLRHLRRSPAVTFAGAVAGAGWWLLGPGLIGALAAAAVGPLLVSVWAHRRLGGVTGDVLGACQQTALVGALCGLTL